MGELFEVNTIKGDDFYLLKSCLEEGIISIIQQLRLGQQEFGSVWSSLDQWQQQSFSYKIFLGMCALEASSNSCKVCLLSAHVQTQSSHLEEELFIVLGFHSLKGFPVKICVLVSNIVDECLSYCCYIDQNFNYCWC